MQTVVALLGVVCIIASPILGALYMLTFFQLGKAVSAVDTATWDRIKLKQQATIAEAREQNRQLKQFISDREYLALGNARITSLAIRFRRLQVATLIAMTGAFSIGVWSVWGPR
jgi:uncharacterized membrane protein